MYFNRLKRIQYTGRLLFLQILGINVVNIHNETTDKHTYPHAFRFSKTKTNTAKIEFPRTNYYFYNSNIFLVHSLLI